MNLVRCNTVITASMVLVCTGMSVFVEGEEWPIPSLFHQPGSARRSSGKRAWDGTTMPAGMTMMKWMRTKEIFANHDASALRIFLRGLRGGGEGGGGGGRGRWTGGGIGRGGGRGRLHPRSGGGGGGGVQEYRGQDDARQGQRLKHEDDDDGRNRRAYDEQRKVWPNPEMMHCFMWHSSRTSRGA